MDNKAIFLDRDGVLIKEVGYLGSVENAEFLPNVFSALKKIDISYALIIVSNQAGIAKGMYTEEDYKSVNTWLVDSLKEEGILIAASYFCPHHPEASVEAYKKVCDCRKPGNGMLKKAEKDLNIDLKNSWMIGDKSSDILAGSKAGCKTILVKTGYAGTDNAHVITPDYVAKTLTDAVDFINSKKTVI